MNIEEIREYCISKPGVTEGFPFNETALLDLSEDGRGISLKCNPERAIQLREEHSEVSPSFHFNKVNM